MWYQGAICKSARGPSPPSVCWHHTHLCPPLWLPSEAERQEQASQCRHGGEHLAALIWDD